MKNDDFVLGGNFDVGLVGTSFGPRRCLFFLGIVNKDEWFGFEFALDFWVCS